MNLLQKTSNPAFTDYFFNEENNSPKTMTVSGVLLKSLASITIIVIISIGIWKLHGDGVEIKWYSMGGLLASIIISLVISVRQHWAHILVPLYAIAKGFFLGHLREKTSQRPACR
jgi:uncharacterized YccA/Bax inhibitor family protein